MHFCTSLAFYFQREINYGTEDEQANNHTSNVWAQKQESSTQDYTRHGIRGGEEKKKKAQTSITNCLQLEDPITLWSRHRECARHRMSMVSYSKRCIVPGALLYWFSNGINDCLILTGFLHGLAKKLWRNGKHDGYIHISM